MPRSLQIYWTGPLLDMSGYAAEGRDLVQALARRGVPIRAESVQQGLLPTVIESSHWRVDAPDADPGAETVQVAHVAWADPFPRRSAERVLWRTMFETDRLPAEWVQRARQVEQVWVPSEWNLGTFASAGVPAEKLWVLPSPLNAEDLVPADRVRERREARRSDRFTFLSVFAWQRRKGWDALLAAYLKEFSANEPVELVLRVDPFLFNGNRDSVEEQVAACVAAHAPRDTPALRLLKAPLSRQGLGALYLAADVFVLPSRGEGWGRPLAEAVACGVPVVTTGWGGQTAFLDDRSAFFVDHELVPVSPEAAGEYGLFAGHRWAEPCVDHLRRIMRRLSSEGDAATVADRTEVALEMRRRFAPDEVAALIARRLGIET